MTKLQRFGNLLLGLLMIACGVVLLLDPHNGLQYVAVVLGLGLVLYGVRKLWYYIRMARHMTGGLSVLFIAIIALDVGLYAIAVIDNLKLALALYVISYCILSGVLSIARGVESKLFGSPWVLHVVEGLVSLAIAGSCITFINSDEVIILVFCLGLFYSAGVRLVSVFKPTEIIYIQ